MPVRAALEYESPWEKLVWSCLDVNHVSACHVMSVWLSLLVVYAMKCWLHKKGPSAPPAEENPEDKDWIMILESQKIYVTGSGGSVHLYLNCGSLNGKRYDTKKICGHCLDKYRNGTGMCDDDETNEART